MKFLFLCSANCRSLMAETLAREIFGQGHEFYSAGCGPELKLNPGACKAMVAECIELEKYSLRRLAEVPEEVRNSVDVVVSLCAPEPDPALFPRALLIRWHFDDPRTLAPGQDDEKVFGRLRDLLKIKLRALTEKLDLGNGPFAKTPFSPKSGGRWPLGGRF